MTGEDARRPVGEREEAGRGDPAPQARASTWERMALTRAEPARPLPPDGAVSTNGDYTIHLWRLQEALVDTAREKKKATPNEQSLA